MRKADGREVKIACSICRIDIDEDDENEKKEEKETTEDLPLSIGDNDKPDTMMTNENNLFIDTSDKKCSSTLQIPQDSQNFYQSNGHVSDVSGDSQRISGWYFSSDNTNNSSSNTLETHEPSPAFKNNQTGDIRRSSVTSMAITSTLATSLVGISSVVPQRIFKKDTTSRVRSPSNGSIYSTNINDDTGLDDVTTRTLSSRRKSKLPLLRLHMPQPHSWSNFTASSDPDERIHHDNHHHYHFPHIPVPTFSFTSDGPGRKFSFGIRRHSQMVSWSGSYRTQQNNFS